jgi:hypothetical protein
MADTPEIELDENGPGEWSSGDIATYVPDTVTWNRCKYSKYCRISTARDRLGRGSSLLPQLPRQGSLFHDEELDELHSFSDTKIKYEDGNTIGALQLFRGAE